MSMLYDTVARLCADRGISVTAACKRAGISPGILSDLKNGRKKTVSIETARSLADALGVSADELTGGTHPAPPAQDDLIAFYGEVKDYLDEDDKQDLIAFMRVKAELKKNDKNRENGTGAR